MTKNIFKEAIDGLKEFSPSERRNIVLYIIGIMIYKFGLEAFNGSIVALATNRYDYDAFLSGTSSKTFERVGLLTGLNQAMQCVGSIIIAPLIKQFPTKNVLSGAIIVFAIFTAILLIVDAAAGGSWIPEEYKGLNHPDDRFEYYGRFNSDGMIPIYAVCGVAYGMVELIRRIIPRDIVGGNVQKLRRMDSVVHIFYEITGTTGAFVTALVLIPQLGNNRAFIITPIAFFFCAISWFFISDLGHEKGKGQVLANQPGYIKATLGGFWLFFESIGVGAKVLFTSRKFIWLVPGYAIALYGHRYLENGIAPQVARRYLGQSGWSQLMVGGSNMGELLGALVVFLFNNYVQTPMPWLRLDSLFLLIVWYIPFWRPPRNQVGQAWLVAATFMPISFGWAAGDVSLAAYIQACLARLESKNKNVSALGAVMAFLYSFYIVTYAILGTFLGRYLDGFTIICVMVFASTFVPKGAVAFNPKMLYDESLDDDVDMQEVTSADNSPEIRPGSRRDNDGFDVYNEKSPAIII
ncbi:major facilitator superfamily domain ral substrate transporter [Diaporthe eres]|nr:major facilitator superfamily domain ral substrate transporter [Diaporthe eres]